MRREYLLLILFVLVISCKGNPKDESAGQNKDATADDSLTKNDDSIVVADYRSTRWGVGLKYPESFKVFEGELPGEAPVINIYEENAPGSPPFGIHEDAGFAYVALLPRGYGVDGPSGQRTTVAEWPESIPVYFDIDQYQSTVYLLENGRPWAYHLVFHTPPEAWTKAGGIFVCFKVQDFETHCFDQDGDPVAMRQCDPLLEHDVKISGRVDKEKAEALHTVLEGLYFFREEGEREPISRLIEVEAPSPGEVIRSPLEIRGRAKGYWYFEAVAPFKLLDSNYRPIAEGIIEAEGDWMSEDFVPFKAEIKFTPPEEERGYLIFNRANASGKPEMDRAFRVPISFSPEKEE